MSRAQLGYGCSPDPRQPRFSPAALTLYHLELQPLIEDQSVQVSGADDAILLSHGLQPLLVQRRNEPEHPGVFR